MVYLVWFIGFTFTIGLLTEKGQSSKDGALVALLCVTVWPLVLGTALSEYMSNE